MTHNGLIGHWIHRLLGSMGPWTMTVGLDKWVGRSGVVDLWVRGREADGTAGRSGGRDGHARQAGGTVRLEPDRLSSVSKTRYLLV